MIQKFNNDDNDNIEIFIQNSDSLYVSYFHQNSYLVKLLFVITDIRLILKGNQLCHYIDMLVSL